jgi:two-component system, chemotaxis family, chemotaxis protein CheY
VRTILIVEDEAPLRELVADLIEDAGYRALQAIHGRQALALIEQERPDVVLSDVMMPVLNGAELCRILKGQPRTAAIPVILMSAAGSAIADGAGADAFVDKPFELSELEALVRRWLPPEHPPE